MKKLEEQIHNLEKIMLQGDKSFKEQELNSKKFLTREYKTKTRAARKRNILIKKISGFFKGKNSNNSTNNKLGSRFSIIKKNEDNGKFRNKDI